MKKSKQNAVTLPPRKSIGKADAEALGILCAAAAGNCINNYF